MFPCSNKQLRSSNPVRSHPPPVFAFSVFALTDRQMGGIEVAFLYKCYY